jgi:hypothetical protein
MRRVDINETFPISIGLEDDLTSHLISGETVHYQIRTAVGDNHLYPPISGTLLESTIEPGVYKTILSLPESGLFVFYATCSGFLTYSEEITVNPEDLYRLVKQERQYNLSIEDVPRTNLTPNASQVLRNVPLNKTDYIINKLKDDDALDWSNPVASGVVYAWYHSTDDDLPFLMGDAFGNTGGVTVSGIYPGGSTLFTELLDTPSTYLGSGGYHVMVKSDNSGLEFKPIDYYTQSEVDTISGTLQDQIDNISFASGMQTGNYPLVSGTNTALIEFSQSYIDTSYGLSINLCNVVDYPPSIYPYIITAISGGGFELEFSGNMDSNNYFVKWMTIM